MTVLCGGAPAAALAAAQAAELAARLRSRTELAGEPRRVLPNPPGADGREELDTSPAPLPRLGGGASDRRSLSGFGGQGQAWQAQSLEKLSGSWPLEPTTISQPLAQASLPEIPAAVPPLNLEATAPWSSRHELPSDAISEGRPSQASLPPPPASVASGRPVSASVPASRRGRSRPTSPMRSEYHWLEVGGLPPVPPMALWLAKAEELERRRSRSAERPVYSSQSTNGFDSLGYAAVWPPPPLPPVSEDLRQRLENLEARRVSEQETVERCQKKHQALEEQLETLRSGERSLQAELSSSKLREEEAKKQLQRVEADRVRLETLIVTVEQQCSDLRQELHDAKGRSGDWQRLHESVKDLEAERDRLRKSYGDSERLLVEAHAENDALRYELRDLKEFKQRAIKAEHQLNKLQEQLEDRSASESRQLQAERQVRGLAAENQGLKKSLQDSEASVQSLRTQNLELEKDQRAWQKAEEESRKAAAILRQEIEKLREERHELDRQAQSTQERHSRRHHTSRSTLQPRPPDSGSSAHRSTIMEVDLRTEGKPHMEEKEVEDSETSSDEYYEQEPPAHIKERLAGLQAARGTGVRQDLR